MASSIAVGTTANNVVDVPVEPDAITWGLQDISSPDAGRVLNANNTMYKCRTSQKRKISLTWNNPTIAQASAILTMFNPEYVFVKYLDVMTGEFTTREFYVGDRSSPFRQIALVDPNGNRTVMSTISFDIIER